MSNIYIQEPPTNGKVSETFCIFNFHFILLKISLLCFQSL